MVPSHKVKPQYKPMGTCPWRPTPNIPRGANGGYGPIQRSTDYWVKGSCGKALTNPYNPNHIYPLDNNFSGVLPITQYYLSQHTECNPRQCPTVCGKNKCDECSTQNISEWTTHKRKCKFHYY